MEEEDADADADQRREVAMASSAALRADFKPKKGPTEAQISKFQELHKRRLQIKAKSKVNKRSKGSNLGKHKSEKIIEACKSSDGQDLVSESVQESTNSDSQTGQDSAGSKRRQKLYWGLDVKERWERKSNM